MRVGISALYYASGGSLTRLSTLLTDWASLGVLDENKIIIFAGKGAFDNLERRLTPEVTAKLEFVMIKVRDRSVVSRLYYEQMRLPAELRKRSIDVLFCAGNTVPFFSRVPSVVEFQNAAPFCESVTVKSVGLRAWLRLQLLGLMMRFSARYAKRVIFISRFFRDVFVQRFQFPAEKGVVIYRAGVLEPVTSDDDVFRRLAIRAPYCLSVSAINPYKHLIEVLTAFAAVRALPGNAEMQLVIAGREDNFPAYTLAVRRHARELNLHEHVVFTSELPHADVQRLIGGCSVFIFSSSCENCPTSLIEALAAGVPIACSNVGVMPEIAGEAALYFDPTDPKSIERTLTELLADTESRERLRSLGRVRATQFPNGSGVAQATLETLKSLSA